MSIPFVQNDSESLDNGKPNQEYYLLQPWGRGNVGYKDAAEKDIWQAVKDVKQTLKIKNNRIYLSGHSMGGSATWRIALQAPDKWAAVCIMSGGTIPIDAPIGIGLGKNASYLPVRIWHGEADGAMPVKQAYNMQSELYKYGNKTDFVIVPGQGHSVPHEHKAANYKWLLEHTRKRPDKFSYVCNSKLHRGVWGISMQRDLSLSALPRFDCTIKGNEVHINSEGCQELNINPGKGGLELNGQVVVFWNSERVYNGPVKYITLKKN